jgi:hypothetical protein
MTADRETIGATQTFVLGRSFKEVDGFSALVCEDGSQRLFCEISADPDRSDVRPQEAYLTLLSSTQPGWSLRLLQLYWPDPVQRAAFQRQVAGWKIDRTQEGKYLLLEGLQLFIMEAPLPFSRRTVLEFIYPGPEGSAWWQGLRGLLSDFGVRADPLDAQAVLELTRQLFHPRLA